MVGARVTTGRGRGMSRGQEGRRERGNDQNKVSKRVKVEDKARGRGGKKCRGREAVTG